MGFVSSATESPNSPVSSTTRNYKGLREPKSNDIPSKDCISDSNALVSILFMHRNCYAKSRPRTTGEAIQPQFLNRPAHLAAKWARCSRRPGTPFPGAGRLRAPAGSCQGRADGIVEPVDDESNHGLLGVETILDGTTGSLYGHRGRRLCREIPSLFRIFKSQLTTTA